MKPVIINDHRETLGRPPRGGRGLKRNNAHWSAMRCAVAPRAGGVD